MWWPHLRERWLPNSVAPDLDLSTRPMQAHPGKEGSRTSLSTLLSRRRRVHKASLDSFRRSAWFGPLDLSEGHDRTYLCQPGAESLYPIKSLAEARSRTHGACLAVDRAQLLQKLD